MMASLIFAILLLLAGLLLFALREQRESLNLRQAMTFLRGIDDEEHAPDPEEFATVIERIRMVLSATKLVRLVSWLLFLPAAVLLSREAHRQLSMGGNDAEWMPFVVNVTAIILLYLMVLMIFVLFQLKTNRLAARDDFEQPEWMLNRDEHSPPLYWFGSLIWERVFSIFDAALRGAHLERPQAQLFEQDRWVRLRIVPHPEGESGEPQNASTLDERSEEQMVRAIQRLDHTMVREVMRPINQVTAIRLNDYTPRRLLELCRRTGYTRIPCYIDQITNLIGYINVYDLLEEDELPENLNDLVIKALMIPEVARVDAVLQEMIRAKQQVAIVFDEFGGTSGWISREDILEEIVGEVADEYERPFRLITESKGGYLVDPSVDLDDLDEELGLELPKRYCDTIAGYVYYRLGRIPKRGETIEEKGWKIRVSAIDNHRIRRLRLIPPPNNED